MLKVAHIADIHSRDKDIDEIKKCLDFIIETVAAEEVDLAVIAGDCFDSRDVKLDSQAARAVIGAISDLSDICTVVIVVGTPSHDGNAPELLRFVRGENPVYVAEKPVQIELKDRAIITLIPQVTKQFFNQGDIQQSNENISQALNGLFIGFGAMAARYTCPHVLVYHGAISGAKLPNNQSITGMDIEVSVDQLNLANPTITLCGHIHLFQELPRKVFYSGSIYANNWGENHPHGFYIHEIEEKQ